MERQRSPIHSPAPPLEPRAEADLALPSKALALVWETDVTVLRSVPCSAGAEGDSSGEGTGVTLEG